MKFRISVFLFFIIVSRPSWAFDTFTIKNVKVEGLERITLGTALTYMPVKVGDEFSNKTAVKAIQALYKTGFFEDISLTNQQGVLIVKVKERPSISSVKIFGNEEVNTEDLNEALKNVGLTEGRVFNRSILAQIEQELRRQYFSLGKYGVKIETSISTLSRNRVDVQIDIEEGEAAHIKNINIIGAKKVSREKLINNFELTTPKMFSKISGSENYSKQQLTADLETLRSYYLDRGYINFNIDSTQVSISPDKSDVFITVNITEGDQFTIKGVKLSGNTIVEKEELIKLIKLKEGEIFSRRKLVDSTNKINQRLGIEGYAFADVNAVPDIDNAAKEIAVTFFIDPGKRVYVRRINISGNTKTMDNVIRRELRQMEGGWISTPLIERSKVRLQRLGYFDEVKVETPAVPGTTDQVDVNFVVEEGSTGNFTAGLGYGQTGGLLFNTSVTLNNFLGTGKRLSLEVNNSKVNQIYSFSYHNPYYTADGISRSFRLSSRSTDASQANLADYTTDSLGASMTFGIPMTEFTSIRLGAGYEKTDININANTAPISYRDWVKDNGSEQEVFNTTMSFAFDTRNRALFPEKGVLSRISAEVAVPAGDLEFYKASYRHKWYIPLSKSVTLLLGGEYFYGAGYGNTDRLPFFENYYLGGFRSVRGFRGNTIGPTDESGGNVGGFRKITARSELFFPSPFTDEQSRNFKLSLFVDAGRLYSNGEQSTVVINDENGDPILRRVIDTIVEDDAIRSSYGLSAVWVTPVGALTFTFSRILKSEEGDSTEFFSFNIGSPF